jgi:uncharacterized protein YjbI with pentapeptide repeats
VRQRPPRFWFFSGGRKAGVLFSAVLAIGGLSGAIAAEAPVSASTVSCPVVASNGTVTPAPAAGVDWSGCDLTNASLGSASLAGANLAGADLAYAYLGSADLASADLSGANLANASLVDANLTSATLSDASLTSTSLLNSVLTDASFTGATLTSTDMSQATVSGADFKGTTLSKILYDGISANGTGTPAAVPASWRFVDGFLLGPTVDLEDNIQLQNADLDGIDLAGAEISNTSLNSASLNAANLAGAIIQDTSVPNATLAGADLTGARLVNSDLTDASLSDANLTGASLYLDTVTGWNVAGATWSNTECPDGFNSDQYLGSCTSSRLGAGYTPVKPTRILDTRNGTGVAKAGALAPKSTLTLSLPTIAGVTAANITAVVLNVTVTGPQGSGVLTVFPGTGTPPNSSNLNFTRGQTVANLVTVPVSGGKVSLYNSSGGTVQVIADAAGVYSASGVGFQAQDPVRVLDTRNGTGAAKRALSSGSRIRLNLSGRVPSGTTAVVLNVTVTGPQKAGWLAVYPDASSKPTTSSLNFASGQTIANQVIVPLSSGIADLYNGSAGTVQVIADLGGYYASSASSYFVPAGPDRILDTRSSAAVKASSSTTFTPASVSNCANCPGNIVAIVANVTATQPAKSGYLIVYATGSPRPATSSLDFSPGETIPNLVTTPLNYLYSLNAYNSSGGTVQVVVDEEGYFITAS